MRNLRIMVAALLLIAACGCQLRMKDGGAIGFRITTGQIGFEFYHESKSTSGEPLIRADVDQGVEKWFGMDFEGDGEADMSVEGNEPQSD